MSYAHTLQGQLILDMVSDGQTVAAACRAAGVNYRSTFNRLTTDDAWREEMEKARASGFEKIAEECLAIADDGTNDTLPNGKADKEWIARSKLRVYTRMQLLSKWHPKKYGDKLQVEQKTATVEMPTSDDPVAAARAYEALLKGG